MNEMTQFRVTLFDRKPGAGITSDGFLGKFAKFHIQRLSDRKTYSYEGHGGGRQFELRCQLLLEAGGVLVEAADPETDVPSTSWKEAIVNRAMEEAERLQ
jgi:hypothetical protein